ncbi:hypothetical protein FA95DRAFT_1506695, partial [Auriscalpium vulgare]
MLINDRPINAIIDTGSQVNIASIQTYHSAIKQPLDLHRSIAMNDANGGRGILKGLASNVGIQCGDVTTYADLYVNENAPFELLLGRPW